MLLSTCSHVILHPIHYYKGEFKEGYIHGYGTYQWGPFYDNDKNKITTKRYEGQFKDGLRHGRGLLLHGNGSSYAGDFRRGHYHGQGVLKLQSEDMGCR